MNLFDQRGHNKQVYDLPLCGLGMTRNRCEKNSTEQDFKAGHLSTGAVDKTSQLYTVLHKNTELCT